MALISWMKFSGFLLLAFVVVLTGCASSKPAPLPYKIYSEADAQLNRDVAAKPLSVVLNIYQLRDRKAFARLTFDDFVSGRSDADLLGEELVKKDELVILPADKQTVDTQLLPDTRYLGLVAIYRQPAEQQWRYLIPADQIRETNLIGVHREKTISLRLRDCFLTLEGVQPELIPGQKLNLEPVCSSLVPAVGQGGTAAAF